MQSYKFAKRLMKTSAMPTHTYVPTMAEHMNRDWETIDLDALFIKKENFDWFVKLPEEANMFLGVAKFNSLNIRDMK